MRRCHRCEDAAFTAIRRSPMHGKDIIQDKNIPFLPWEIDRVLFKLVHDMIEIALGNRSVVAEAYVMEKGMLLKIDELRRQITPPTEEFRRELENMGLIEPYIFICQRMDMGRGTRLAEGEPIVSMPVKAHSPFPADFLDFFWVRRFKDLLPGTVGFSDNSWDDPRTSMIG